MGGGSPWLVAEAVGLLVAVYVPAFAIASLGVSFVKSRTSQTEETLRITALPMLLTVSISLTIALILIAIVSHGDFASFGFRSVPAQSIWQSLFLGLGFGIALALGARLLRTRLAIVEGLPMWQVTLLAGIATPLQEEIIFRGLFQGVLEKAPLGILHLWGWAVPVAALITAVVFALAHLGLLTTGATLGTAAFLVSGALVLGLLAGYFRWVTGSLIPCFILHALFNILGITAEWFGRSSAL